MKRLTAAALILALVLAMCSASAAGGGAADPVITKSYIDNVYIPSMSDRTDALIEERFDNILTDFESDIGEASSSVNLYKAALLAGGFSVEQGEGGIYTASEGTVIAGYLGVMFTLYDGQAKAYMPGIGTLLDISEGAECRNGQYLTPGHCYMAADALCGIEFTDDGTVGVEGDYMLIGYGGMTPANAEQGQYRVIHSKYADALYEMGLFAGTDNGYDLDKQATRAQAVVMLIRMLGEEKTAQGYTGRHPFKDVPAWASRYVAYAYNMGYTAGTAEDEFAPDAAVTAAQYITFVLRALGYSDKEGDFHWESAGVTAVGLGMLTNAENKAMNTMFLRDHMVYVSYRALSTGTKGVAGTLAERLIAAGAIAKNSWMAAQNILG